MKPALIRLLAVGVLIAGCLALVVNTNLWSGAGGLSTGAASASARAVEWKDLIPDGAVVTLPRDASSDFPDVASAPRVRSSETGGDPGAPDGTPWPATDANAPRPDLAGKRVALAGYMTPFNVLEGKTRTFLLVPYVGACIHVPAPPPNQVVLVEAAEPVEVRPMWQPFRAVGRLGVERIDTGLAEVGYTMELEAMEPYEDAGGKLEGVRSIDDGD